ncbi:MAG: GntR family transcriptional regulator [Synergistaceae bacterium]|nr:GntR family transcriptional regulator [Synergistaceae bacterium]
MPLFHNESLRKKLYDYIRQKMNNGELRRGEKINQKEIFDKLGISRTPYRDCMIQLEAEGLVEIIPCKGAVVRELAVRDVMELQEIGGALEGTAFELSFEGTKKNSAKQLEALIETVEGYVKEGLPIDSEINAEFHNIVLSHCPNRSLVETIEKMRERLYDFPRPDPRDIVEWETEYWREHRHQLEILRKGTAREFGDFTKYVHWGVEGKEKYWEIMYNLRPGSVEEYFARRNSGK